jgi:hypothetical protein
MYILGDKNWQLPRWLSWLPQIHIEPEEPAEALMHPGTGPVQRPGDPGA